MTDEKTNPAPVEAAPEPQAAPAEPAAANAGKPKTFKMVLIIGGAVLLLAAAVVGYGFFNGKMVKDYATKADKWMTESDTWGDSFNSNDPASMKTEMDKIVKDSADMKSEVEKTSAPAKAKVLKQNLVDYFTLSSTASKKLYDYAIWAVAIQDAGKDITGTTEALNTSTPESMATSLETIRDSMQKTYDKINDPAFNVPKGAEKTNDAFKKMLKDMIAVYNKMIPAIRANDLAALNSAMSDLSGSLSGLSGLDTTGDDITAQFKEDVDKATKLETDIKAQITELEKVNFSF